MIDIVDRFWSYLLLGTWPKGPVGGLVLTLYIALVCLAITIPVAMLIALARTSGSRILRRIATAYVYAMRGLPLLFLLLWVYFLLPVALGVQISSFWTLVIAIVLYQGAYTSEVIRGGIEALPPGQREAARALGLTAPVIMWKVILPQALFNVLPGLISQFTIIIKESALGYVIALGELTYVTGRLNALLMTQALSVYAILAVIYFIVCFAMSRLVERIEVQINRRRTPGVLASNGGLGAAAV